MIPFNSGRAPSSVSMTTSRHREKGYPWLFLYMGRPLITGLVVTLLVISLGVAFYLWYDQPGNDTAPDSIVGLIYAVLGTIFLTLAAVLYSLRRRLHKRAIGQLNASLSWHMFFAILGLAMILMHSFGNFHPLSGTYALYGMIALTVSGIVGRALDHFIPRLITAEVSKVLTMQGEDRITSISQKLQAIVVHNKQEEELHGFRVNVLGTSKEPLPVQSLATSSASQAGRKPTTPWDLAYISVEPTPQELERDAPRLRFFSDKKSGLVRSSVAIPGAEEHISALQAVQGSMRREQFYRYIIHYWRVLHISLALLTIGLVIWHLIFAAQLLLPTLFHAG
jgi:hypothetical protein